MAHRKWNETKLQPSMLPGQAVLGCSLVSFLSFSVGHPMSAGCTAKKVKIISERSNYQKFNYDQSTEIPPHALAGNSNTKF